MQRILTLLLFIATATSSAWAAYTGPGATPAVTSVAEARLQRDDQTVVLRGQLVAKLGDERYRFQDDTGVIDVEIDDEDLPRDTVSADTLVELHGRWTRIASSRAISTSSMRASSACAEAAAI